MSEVGIYKRKRGSKKERKHDFDQEKIKKTHSRLRKKESKQELGREKRKKPRSRPRKKNKFKKKQV